METISVIKHDHCNFATIINKPLHFVLFSGEDKKWILWEEKHKGCYRFFTEVKEEKKDSEKRVQMNSFTTQK